MFRASPAVIGILSIQKAVFSILPIQFSIQTPTDSLFHSLLSLNIFHLFFIPFFSPKSIICSLYSPKPPRPLKLSLHSPPIASLSTKVSNSPSVFYPNPADLAIDQSPKQIQPSPPIASLSLQTQKSLHLPLQPWPRGSR
jgi:hypothetical protein